MNFKNLNWEGFEDLVYRIQANDYPDAEVLLDTQITDLVTGQPRQVDIAIRVPRLDGSYVIVVECKHYKTRPITQPNVEQFASFLKSVGAHKGVMVASSGFSASAAIYARTLDIDLFTVEQAEGVEWQKYIAEATRPVIKKRLSSADIAIRAGSAIVTLGRDVLLGKDADLNLYAKDNGEFIPMEAYHKKYHEANFNFFLNMPQLPGLLFEMIEEQVTTKLDTSKSGERDQLRAEIRAETGQEAWTSYINHLVYDKATDVAADDQSRIAWWAKVMGSMQEMQAPQRRYLRLEDGFAPIDAINVTYRAEISVGRYHGIRELSPLDLCSGVAYVDVHADSRRYYVLSELFSRRPRRGGGSRPNAGAFGGEAQR